MIQITLSDISKKFNKDVVFKDVTCTLNQNTSTAILGSNGTGKSTLLQIIAGYSIPTSGHIYTTIHNKPLAAEHYFKEVSFVAPYMDVIEEMTLLEFFTFHFSFKTTAVPIQKIISYIGLEESTHKYIENFSSGMKQRVKLAQCLFATSSVALLDEPCSNLDTEGIALYHKMIKEFGKNKIIVVASNKEEEYSFCTSQIHLKNYK